MNLKDLKKDCAQKQKKGIHFIIASVVIWIMVLIVQLTDLPILTKNLLTFCCTAPLLPIAFLISKILKIQFQDKRYIIFCKSNDIPFNSNVDLSYIAR